jgi:hypothetical protein
MMQHYAQLIVLHSNTLGQISDEAGKLSLIRWIEWVKITLQSAEREHSHEYQRVKRRTIIVVADIVEAIVEIELATCLEHLDPSGPSVRTLTGYKRKIGRDFDSKMAVRSWERTLYVKHPSRSKRFEHMIRCFFSGFVLPENADLIDQLITYRNELTHDVIPISRVVGDVNANPNISHEQIDSFFEASGDFMLRMLTAIPGDLKDQIPAFDARYKTADLV